MKGAMTSEKMSPGLLRVMKYRHQPILRVHIPKDKKTKAADRVIMLRG